MDAKQNGNCSAMPTVIGNIAQFPKDCDMRPSFGCTKRELAAMMALQGLCANSSDALMAVGIEEAEDRGEKRMEQTFSRWAVAYADALLAELAKEVKP